MEEIKGVLGKVVSIQKSEKVDNSGANKQSYKIGLVFDWRYVKSVKDYDDVKIKVTIATSNSELAESFSVGEAVKLSILRADRSLEDFDKGE
jgi:hypothetical protein